MEVTGGVVGVILGVGGAASVLGVGGTSVAVGAGVGKGTAVAVGDGAERSGVSSGKSPAWDSTSVGGGSGT